MAKANTLTVGIDLGDQFSQVCVLDEEGEVVEESKIRTTKETFRKWLGGMEEFLAVMEVGTHSPWVSRLLRSMGQECLVANPASLHRSGRKKSDKIDAEKLARWARSDPGMLEAVQHPGADIQADMAVIHSRRALVETRTKLINRTRGLVKSWGARLPRCDADYFGERAAPHVPPDLKTAVDPLLETIASLTGRIKLLEEQIETLAMEKYGEATRRLTQVKGVGTITALSYVLTVRQPERFPKSRQVGPYLGLTPRLDQSGESEIEHRISKAGNVYMRLLLVQAAHHVLERGPDTDIKRWGLRKAEGGKRAKRRAVVAVARKLAVLLHHLWQSGEDYQPLRQTAA